MHLQGSRSRALPRCIRQAARFRIHKLTQEQVDHGLLQKSGPLHHAQTLVALGHSELASHQPTSSVRHQLSTHRHQYVVQYTCTNSMQDFLPGTYSPDWTESSTGLGGTKQDTTSIGTIRWLICDDDGALHEFIFPNVWFIPSNPICILSLQCLAEDLQDEYNKGTGEMTMAGKTVLFWDGRQYKRIIRHHSHSKCPLLPTKPAINAVHQFMQVWNDCLPRESVKVNTRSRPPRLLQMLAPKPPTNPITFLSSIDLQLDNMSTATADSNDASITSTMTYNEGHEDELTVLLMPNLLRG
jgi:hypothetical protein